MTEQSDDPVERFRQLGRAGKRLVVFSQAHSPGIQAICAVLIFVVTAVYAFYAAEQWRTMERQLNDNEAAQSAQVVIEDLRYPLSESPPKLHFKIINVGQTSALNITVGVGGGAGMVKSPNGYLAYPPAEAIEATARDRMKGESDEQVGFSLGPGKEREFSEPSGSISPEILNGTMFAYHQVFVGYRNIFGKKKFVSDCIFYSVKGGAFIPCPTGRIAD
jgi:hypothetical protein